MPFVSQSVTGSLTGLHVPTAALQRLDVVLALA